MKNNNLFTIKYGATGGDCTCLYYITLLRDCTVKEFIEECLKDKNEWGDFGIYKEHNIFGEPRCKYIYGELITAPFPENILNSKIKRATGSGGWTNSDFLFY